MDEAILAAAMDLLAEIGYARLTEDSPPQAAGLEPKRLGGLLGGGFSPATVFSCHTRNTEGVRGDRLACHTSHAGRTDPSGSAPMLRTVQCACTLPKDDADALNAESGRLSTDMVVCHYRVYRRKGVWLPPAQGDRGEDAHGGPTPLHAHSRDAAQQSVYTACKTATACHAVGLDTKYP